MTLPPIPGAGHKRPQLDIAVDRLHLDPSNPRLPQEATGGDEGELLRVLVRLFNLDELADSMSRNGYFDEEPLVVVPRDLPKSLRSSSHDSPEFARHIAEPTTHFLVVEGNRRLATAKILLNNNLRTTLRIKDWPILSDSVSADLRALPCIVYVEREQVAPYLGVRHIVGIQKWEPYAKARYISSMIAEGKAIKDLEAQIGDRQGAITRNFVAYQMLQQASEELDFDTRQAQGSFSLLILAIGQGNIKRFLALPPKLGQAPSPHPIPSSHIVSLRELLVWIFGDGEKRPVISESRDITNYLTHVVSSPEALEHLRATGDLSGAYERSDGEEALLLKFLRAANLKLEGALGIAHRHKIAEALAEAEKAKNTAIALIKALGQNDAD